MMQWLSGWCCAAAVAGRSVCCGFSISILPHPQSRRRWISHPSLPTYLKSWSVSWCVGRRGAWGCGVWGALAWSPRGRRARHKLCRRSLLPTCCVCQIRRHELQHFWRTSCFHLSEESVAGGGGTVGAAPPESAQLMSILTLDPAYFPAELFTTKDAMCVRCTAAWGRGPGGVHGDGADANGVWEW